MKFWLGLVVLLACTPTALSQEKTNDFAELDARIQEQLSTDTWHSAAKSLIRSQWEDYKKAHEQPGKRGDFHGARCYGGIVCFSTIDDLKHFAGEYGYKGSSESAESLKPDLKIIMSEDNRVFVVEDGRRLPAFANNNIIFYTDGTLVKQMAPLGNKHYGQLEIRMIYKANHFGWVTGPVDSYVDDMLKLVKLEKNSDTGDKTRASEAK